MAKQKSVIGSTVFHSGDELGSEIADDPKMRALEAYIIAHCKGVPLDYGKR